MPQNSHNTSWDLVIRPKSGLLQLNLKEVWKYRDLLLLFVKRDFITQYKQTILGPFWYIIQPMITTALYVMIFGSFAKLPTDGSPYPLFYLSGIIMWNFFSVCMSGTSNTFTNNASIFGKIYFPRLIIPISTIISNLIRFGIQYVIFLGFMVYYMVNSNEVHMSWLAIVMTPVFLLIMALMGLGFGIIISSLTTKYRDLTHFLGFGIQLLMYLTPVIYPASFWGKYEWLFKLNPLASIFENFRHFYIGTGTFDPAGLAYSAMFAIVIFFFGAILFNRIEKTFMDTV